MTFDLWATVLLALAVSAQAAENCTGCLQTSRMWCKSATVASYCSTETSQSAAGCTRSSGDGTADIWVTTIGGCVGGCYTADGCDECTAPSYVDAQCGYCSQGGCMQGGANGAAPGGCSGGGKTWLFGTCTKSCSQRTSCVECLASDVCHYCEGTDSCVDAGSGSACLADQMKCPGFDTGDASGLAASLALNALGVAALYL